MEIQIHCTVQVLNVCAIDELIEWGLSAGIEPKQFYFNILNHPECMNIRSLPIALKNLAELKLQPYLEIPKVQDIIRYMWAEDWHEKRWGEFVAYNTKIDELQRGELLDVCPEFKDYV